MWARLRRNQLASMGTARSGKGWGWERRGTSMVAVWEADGTHYSTVQAESQDQGGASN